MAEQTAIELEKCLRCGADECGFFYSNGKLLRTYFACGTEIWYEFTPDGVTYKGSGCDAIAALKAELTAAYKRIAHLTQHNQTLVHNIECAGGSAE